MTLAAQTRLTRLGSHFVRAASEDELLGNFLACVRVLPGIVRLVNLILSLQASWKTITSDIMFVSYPVLKGEISSASSL